MLTPQGVLNTGRGSLDTALRIGQRLTTLKLEEATAAEPRRLHGSAFGCGVPVALGVVNGQPDLTLT